MNKEKSVTSQNITWHESTVKRTDREALNGHRGAILWFTGLSGSGKSTLANAMEMYLYEKSARTFVLDGDNIRHGLCKDLGFSDRDRSENIRRIGEVSRLMVDAGIITMTAFISPFIRDRQIVRNLVQPGDFIEIFCRASLDACEKRDPKGLYKKARSGVIPEFTGISSPYEEPEDPELTIDTESASVEECIDRIAVMLDEHGIFKAN